MVSVDSILTEVVDKAGMIQLDEGRPTGHFDLCRTLDELREKIDVRKNQGIRMFAYTQAQNIHVSSIARDNASVPPGVHFDVHPYASRLQRVDACFGKFIEYLEAQGLYDYSVVVFTADHGDLLGEEGRWGHAYNLNPEVTRIPLIIHLNGHAPRAVGRSDAHRLFDRHHAEHLPLARLHADHLRRRLRPVSLRATRRGLRMAHARIAATAPSDGILEDKRAPPLRRGRGQLLGDVLRRDRRLDGRARPRVGRGPLAKPGRIAAGIADLHKTWHVEATSRRWKPASSASPSSGSHE